MIQGPSLDDPAERFQHWAYDRLRSDSRLGAPWEAPGPAGFLILALFRKLDQ